MIRKVAASGQARLQRIGIAGVPTGAFIGVACAAVAFDDNRPIPDEKAQERATTPRWNWKYWAISNLDTRSRMRTVVLSVK